MHLWMKWTRSTKIWWRTIYLFTLSPNCHGWKGGLLTLAFMEVRGLQNKTLDSLSYPKYTLGVLVWAVSFFEGPWKSVHIDDLRKSEDIVSDIKALRNLTISELFDENRTKPEGKDVRLFFIPFSVLFFLFSNTWHVLIVHSYGAWWYGVFWWIAEHHRGSKPSCK